MSQLERLQKINQMIHERTSVSVNSFLQELEISLATFKRDLEKLRSHFNAPIIYEHESGGYIFDKPNAGKKFELPGMWFDESEATALVLMQHLLSGLDQGGLIGPHITPLMSRIDAILGNGETSSKELRKRIKVLGMGSRKTPIKNFSEIGRALLNRNRLNIAYYARSSNEESQREISPQSLVYYRDNWYLDAYCHLRNDLRSFAIDGIKSYVILDKKTQEISNKDLEDNFANSYGIFSGKATKTAKLRFTPERARWVSSEMWHPNQIGKFDEDGYYILEFDYNQEPELIMDILKHGSHVEVLHPSSLKKQVIFELKKSLQLYN
jgi:predicted DNA-binding transcriptional regulator YafY